VEINLLSLLFYYKFTTSEEARKMVKRGLGEYQIKKAEKSRNLVMNVLANGDWLRYTQLANQTSLSTATVSKFLKELEKEGEIQKKVDIESGEYPYPAYYRLTDRGLERVNKEALKKRIDETPPLERYSMEITRQNLKTKVDVPGWYKKLDRFLTRLGFKEADKRNYEWPTTYSIFSESKLVEEWKDELYQQISTMLKKRHPKLEGEMLDFLANFLMTSLFASLEETAYLNILTSLKLPPIGNSKYKPISARYELDLYTEIYSRLLDAVVLFLRKKFDQSKNFEDFLEETRGTNIFLSIDLKTDFQRIVETFDKKILEIEQLRART